jgi:hypothetical protein
MQGDLAGRALSGQLNICFVADYEAFALAQRLSDGLQTDFNFRSVSQFAEIVHHHIRTMVPKLLRIPLPGDADHKSKVAAMPGLDSRDGILDDDGARRLNLKQFGGHQKGVRGGFACQLSVKRVAIDSHREEGIEPGGL